MRRGFKTEAERIGTELRRDEEEGEAAYVAKLSGFDLRVHVDSLLRKKLGIGFYETAPSGMLAPLQRELHSGAENSVYSA